MSLAIFSTIAFLPKGTIAAVYDDCLTYWLSKGDEIASAKSKCESFSPTAVAAKKKEEGGTAEVSTLTEKLRDPGNWTCDPTTGCIPKTSICAGSSDPRCTTRIDAATWISTIEAPWKSASAKAETAGISPRTSQTKEQAPGAKGRRFEGLTLVGACFGGSGENCTLDDIVRTGAAFANFITGLSAALFFATFVYGGARYLLSFGNAKHVQIGTDAMKGAAIGMGIVLFAWTLVNYIANAIRGIS